MGHAMAHIVDDGFLIIVYMEKCQTGKLVFPSILCATLTGESPIVCKEPPILVEKGIKCLPVATRKTNFGRLEDVNGVFAHWDLVVCLLVPAGYTDIASISLLDLVVDPQTVTGERGVTERVR